VRQEDARPAHAGLHLIDDQQAAHLIGQLADGRQVTGRRDVDAPLALDGLHENGGRLRAHRFGERVDVPKRHVHETGRQRLQLGVELRLPGGGQRRQGAAVERLQSADDLVALLLQDAPGIEAGQLDRPFISLRTAVGEENLHAAGQFGQLGGQLHLRDVVIDIGTVHQLGRLPADGFHHARVAVADPVDGDAGEKVQVLLAILIPNPSPAGSLAHQRHAAIGLYHVLSIQTHNLLGIH